MAKLFIVSSAGDTDLAKETLKRLLASGYHEPVFILPLTDIARGRIADLTAITTIHSLNEIIRTSTTPKRLEAEQIKSINDFIAEHHIDMVYLGVPSPSDEDMPFQIAAGLNIPFVIASEFMFKAEEHCFWSHAGSLAAKELCTFAVPLPGAEADIKKLSPDAKVKLIGHLSIDKALKAVPIDVAETKAKLHIHDEQRFIFISGTSQPHHIDNQFLEALLAELATGRHPTLQLRFSIHPGVSNIQLYLETLLATCSKYPTASTQFKLILPSTIRAKLTAPDHFNDNPFVTLADVNGPLAANAADNIAQAVPGALLNEAAVMGKPTYFHGKSTPYLPQQLFADSIPAFFAASTKRKGTPADFGLDDDAPDAPTSMARVISTVM